MRDWQDISEGHLQGISDNWERDECNGDGKREREQKKGGGGVACPPEGTSIFIYHSSSSLHPLSELSSHHIWKEVGGWSGDGEEIGRREGPSGGQCP